MNTERWLGMVVAASLLPCAAALAQRPPIQETPLPPLTNQDQPPGQPRPLGRVPQVQGPPGVQSQPQPPSQAGPGRPIQLAPPILGPAPGQILTQPAMPTQTPPQAPGQTPDLLQGPIGDETPAAPPTGGDQPAPAETAVQPPWPNQWLPAGGARIQALDKVNAQAMTLTVKIGQPATFGSLTIAVKACMIRPPDQPADAAAYLDVTDSHPDSPGFDGWMLANEPSVSMMQNPIYDLRVAGCV